MVRTFETNTTGRVIVIRLEPGEDIIKSIEKIVAEKKRLAQASNDIFSECFPNAPLLGHPLSFFRWLPIPGELNAIQMVAALQSRGIRVFHSDRFLRQHALTSL